MKMAKATEKDLEDAVILNGILSAVLEDEQTPRGADGKFGDEIMDYFDEDDSDHLRKFYDVLKEVYRRSPGGMNRVIWGMHTVLSAGNAIVDPDADHLALHPRFAAMEGRIAELEGELAALKGTEGTEMTQGTEAESVATEGSEG